MALLTARLNFSSSCKDDIFCELVPNEEFLQMYDVNKFNKLCTSKIGQSLITIKSIKLESGKVDTGAWACECKNYELVRKLAKIPNLDFSIELLPLSVKNAMHQHLEL